MAEEKDKKNNKKKTKEVITKLKKTKISVLYIAIAAVLLTLFMALGYPLLTKKPGQQKVDTVSTLEKIVKNSSLSTYEVVYNGVSTVYNEKKPENVDYYVSYEATVKAGFDFKQIGISKDDENHEIIVSLPQVKLFDPKVMIEDLDYIIVNKKLKTETISADAYKVCIADVKEEAKKQKAIIDYAKENGEKLIKGLVEPFISQLEEEYTLKFEWRNK